MTLRRISILLTTLFIMIFFGSTLPAQAADDCTIKVVDTTEKSLLDKLAIEAAINKLENTGADVYVRAFEKTPDGNIDTYYRNTVKACSNWLSPNGETPKGNLIFIGFGMDRTSQIAYGEQWHIVDPKLNSIRAEALNTGLRNGEYTQAVTSTLVALESAITSPESNSGNTGTPVDFGAILGSILIVILVIVSLVIAFFGGRYIYRLFAAQREKKEAYETAKATAQASKDAAERAYTTLLVQPQIENANAKEELALRTLNLPQTVTEGFEQKLENIQKKLNATITAYKAAISSSETPVTTNDYLAFASKYDTLSGEFRQTGESLSSLWREIDEVNDDISPKGRERDLAVIDNTLNAIKATLESITSFSTLPYDQRLSKLVMQAATLASPSDTLSAWDARIAIKQLESNIGDLSNELGELVGLQQRIRRAPQELRTLHTATTALVNQAGLDDKYIKKYQKQLISLDQSIDEFSESPDKNPEKLIRQRNNLYASIENVANAYRTERRKVSVQSRRTSTSNRRKSSSSASSRSKLDDSLTGGFIGGYIGSSSSGSHSSHSSSSDSGSSSSGSWGGGDSGSSSSGSW